MHITRKKGEAVGQELFIARQHKFDQDGPRGWSKSEVDKYAGKQLRQDHEMFMGGREAQRHKEALAMKIYF